MWGFHICLTLLTPIVVEQAAHLALIGMYSLPICIIETSSTDGFYMMLAQSLRQMTMLAAHPLFAAPKLFNGVRIPSSSSYLSFSLLCNIYFS
jgi:hypothetical protein